MDTELLRTFLEINRTRHFGRAAANLYLTQSAVSARMRLLEQVVGQPLMTRDRNDIQLTPTGRKLLPHAEAIVERWVQAQQDVATHEDIKATLHLGALAPLADSVLQDWMLRWWDEMPDLALSLEALPEALLTSRLLERSLDLAIGNSPAGGDSLKHVKLREIELALFSTTQDQSVEQAMHASNHIQVEWGGWFNVQLAKAFPDSNLGGLRTASVNLVLGLLKARDGSSYLPFSQVGEGQSPELHLVEDAPRFKQEIFASYALDSDQRGAIEEALYILRQASLID